jgi:hypothetical protein
MAPKTLLSTPQSQYFQSMTVQSLQMVRKFLMNLSMREENKIMPVIILNPVISYESGAGANLLHVELGDTINPVMSADNEPAGHLVVSNWFEGSSWAPWKAFNYANTDYGWAGRPVGSELWIAYKHPTPELVNRTRITSLTQGSDWVCNSYEVYGTNDDFSDEASAEAATWVLLDTVSCPGLVGNTWSEYFDFENTTAYSGYMFKATSWGSNGVQIQEIEFVSAGPINLVPTMTDVDAPSGAVSSSSGQTGTNASWKLFDGTSSLWYSNGDTTQWVQYKFETAQRVTQVSVTSANNGDYMRAPNEFTIVGSNTGAFAGEETLLLTVDGSEDFAQGETKTWNFEAASTFTHYRMNITGKQQGFGYSVEYLFDTLAFNGPGFAPVAGEAGGETGVDLIPAMTSSTDPSGVASSSGDYGASFAAWKAMDGVASLWYSDTNLTPWIQYEFPEAKVAGSVRLTAPSNGDYIRTPNEFTIVGSNTGDFGGEETLLLTVNDDYQFTIGETKTWNFQTQGAYTHYRMNITGKQGGTGYSVEYILEEFQLISGDGSVSSVVVPDGVVNLVPAMTSNTDPEGTTSASSETTGAFNAMDNSTGNWQSGADDVQWLQYQFDTAQTIYQLSMTSISNGDYIRCPNEFTIVGSNTGAFVGEETLLLTVDDSPTWAAGEEKVWTFDSVGEFTHYRMNITGKQGAFGAAAEYVVEAWGLLGEAPVGGGDAVAVPDGVVNLVPTMTSNTDPEGIASSSSGETGSFAVWKLFDGTSGLWYSDDGDAQWVQYQFDAAKTIYQMTMTAVNSADSNRAPNEFTIVGSNTGAFAGEETLLLTVDDAPTWIAGETKTWTFDAIGEFTHYRMNITGKPGPFGYGTEYVVDSWGLLGEDVPATSDLIPAMTSNTTPSGVASASSEYGASYAIWKAMDQSSGLWYSGSDVTQWVQYEFDTVKEVSSVTIKAPNNGDYIRTPNEFTIVGSNTGDFGGEETLLLTVSDAHQFTQDSSNTWVFDTTGSFTHYRMNITGKQGGTGYSVEYIMDTFQLTGVEGTAPVEEGSGAVNLIPAMTSNTTPSGTVSASSGTTGSFPIWHAFNQAAGVWYSDSADSQWITYAFDENVTVETMTLKATDTADYPRCPNTFTLVGSATGAFTGEEALLLTANGEHSFTAGSSNTWTLDTTGSFQYYKLNITGKQQGFGAGVEYIIDEMQFAGTVDGGTGGSGAVSGATINPIMTAADAPSPSLVVSNWFEGSSWAPYQAFNHNNQDLGWAGRPVDGELWIAYKHDTAVVVDQTRVTAYTGTWGLTSYEVYGTNDDFTDQASAEAATWVLLDTVASVSTGSGTWSPYYSFSNTTAYKAYKLRVTGHGSLGAQIQEIEFVAA